MNRHDTLRDEANDRFLEFLKYVISGSHACIKSNEVSRALLFLLVRVSNTWRSIRTLDEHTPDEEGPMLDAGTLLRAMFDAYLQAEYICADQNTALQRSRDYLDFEHVERYKLAQKVAVYDNPLTKALKASPKRPAGEQRIQQEYERVKSRYTEERPKSPGSNRHKPRVRQNWYPGNLAEIARALGKSDEYDLLLASFHGCVHSSPFSVAGGPMVAREYILDWASTIAARVARLSVAHNSIELNEFYRQMLTSLCRPYFRLSAALPTDRA